MFIFHDGWPIDLIFFSVIIDDDNSNNNTLYYYFRFFRINKYLFYTFFTFHFVYILYQLTTMYQWLFFFTKFLIHFMHETYKKCTYIVINSMKTIPKTFKFIIIYTGNLTFSAIFPILLTKQSTRILYICV